MKTLLMIAGAAMTFAGGLTAPSAAEAQNWRRAPGYTYDGYGRDYRDYRDYRGGARQYRYWRDGYGRHCYRRYDGVRRCEADGPRRRHRSDRYW